MSADDLRHRARTVIGEQGPTDVPHGVAVGEAARVPAEYREAYLEGFARVLADRDDTAA